ncbi:MAG: flagellar basal body P-ring protein FlgI [Syntrophaceae bacterium]|nr:flagellar basal body P-ring protein FlgI [Syntrophaceae bacterium]
MARIKDIAAIGGIRDNNGSSATASWWSLMNTGDSIKNSFEGNPLEPARPAGTSPRQGPQVNNIAAVMVSGPSAALRQAGSSSMSWSLLRRRRQGLLGGTLLMTPLGAPTARSRRGPGPVVIGGSWPASTPASGGAMGKNHDVGYVSNRALIEEGLQYDFVKTRRLTVNLYQPDFDAHRLASAMNSRIGDVDVKLVDSGSTLIDVSIPSGASSACCRSRNLDVSVDTPAVVVLNEKTGTVVMKRRFPLSPSPTDLGFQIREEFNVSQPLPYAPPAAWRRRRRGPGRDDGLRQDRPS